MMFGLAIHGGAGTLPRQRDVGRKLEANYRAGLEQALTPAMPCSKAAARSLDAVTRAVMALEDNPLFNAGRGAGIHARRPQRTGCVHHGGTTRCRPARSAA